MTSLVHDVSLELSFALQEKRVELRIDPDMPTVRAIVREAAKQDYRISAFITGVIASHAFQMRAIDDTPGSH